MQYSASQSEYFRTETQKILNSVKIPPNYPHKALSQSISNELIHKTGQSMTKEPKKSSLKTEIIKDNKGPVSNKSIGSHSNEQTSHPQTINISECSHPTNMTDHITLENASCPETVINTDCKDPGSETTPQAISGVEVSNQSEISKDTIQGLSNGTQEDNPLIIQPNSLKNITESNVNNQSDFPIITRQPDFINAIFDRMAQLFEQPKEVNLYITEILSRIAMHPSPFIYTLLLSHTQQHKFRSLPQILTTLVENLKQEAIDNLTLDIWLLEVRKHLCGLSTASLIGTPNTNIELLEGAIILEEFLKEMAAISFVRHSNSILPI